METDRIDENADGLIHNDDAYQLMRVLDDAFGNDPQPEKRSDEEYAELQRQLILYKQGSPEACSYIIKSFHMFLTKYARFICLGHLPRFVETNVKTGGKFIRTDPSIAKFVGLYVSSEMKKEYPVTSKRFYVACNMIKDMFEKYQYADIYNELVLALLNMAGRYKIIEKGDKFYKRNGTFPMYIHKCFHWEAKRCLDKLVEENYIRPVNFMYINDFDNGANFFEEFIEDEAAAIAFDEGIEKANRTMLLRQSDSLVMNEDNDMDIYSDDSLNFNWTNGTVCSELFSSLTPFEREILVMNFARKQSADHIAKIYGYNKVTINRYKKKAIDKIRSKAQELGIKIPAQKGE